MAQRYLVALGSNRRHHRHGRPEQVLRAALKALADAGITVEAAAPILRSAPLGPSLRRYANGAALVACEFDPPALLAALKRIERAFGRRPRGQRWGARVLDLDVVLWSGGAWRSRGLCVPHPLFRERAFVLGPARAIAPQWRDPGTGLRIRHLYARLTRPLPLPRAAACRTHPNGALSSVGRATDF